MHFSGLILASLATVAVAAPTSNVFNEVYNFDSSLGEFYARVSAHIGQFPKGATSTCEISKVALPSSKLPAATGTLKYVAVGRGTQNYTCADSTADTIPAQAGAVANLYDASCIAANFPDLLNLITDIILNFSLPAPGILTPLAPANLDLLGHHYFETATKPAFNLNTTPQKQYGIALTAKQNATAAPAESVLGQFNVGYGAVPWLYLSTVPGTTDGYSAVYRVNTAGGSAPATCAGQPAAFQVQYSAQYFIYA
ncbi:hypothetical protein TMatcc_006312 [Talaromyces marneffei ATCC 18224]|uniref:Conserved fungal protein n=2 Tax=Talaromyces marneffei TaxID=37727 RepID=B6QBI7_TALMQ|nr:uncharacterized protein EYB26_002736 [Talaromyces marneffei]EEA25463.1 conserved fungal protein [Talaromyces marneffei ATCC 18224]KAE8554186.1 hypothetical protein EYB25_002724 [Talaromyces marneffei]QGA15080.1 hypothetical protein EYB26_002736 [Talaromyces marneffei]